MREITPLAIAQPAGGNSSEALLLAYDALRARLIQLSSAANPDMAAIDSVIDQLAQAQLAVKASRGLIGNNPNDD